MGVFRYHTRWIIGKDYPEVLFIENESFEHTWDEEDLLRELRKRNVIGMVAEYGDNIVGYMVYELHPDYLNLLRLAVHPNYRFMGVGKALIETLTTKRPTIQVDVPDNMLDAHFFLRQCGFKARSLPGGDVYQFRRDVLGGVTGKQIGSALTRRR